MGSRLFKCPRCYENWDGQMSLLRDDCRCSWCLYRCLPSRIAGEEISVEDVLVDPRYAPA